MLEKDLEKERFKHKLFRELEIEENPKREKFFQLVWDIGHAFGYREVEIHAKDLVELIK